MMTINVKKKHSAVYFIEKRLTTEIQQNILLLYHTASHLMHIGSRSHLFFC